MFHLSLLHLTTIQLLITLQHYLSFETIIRVKHNSQIYFPSFIISKYVHENTINTNDRDNQIIYVLNSIKFQCDLITYYGTFNRTYFTHHILTSALNPSVAIPFWTSPHMSHSSMLF